ncbi:MAG: hypothetical protein GEV13_17270 [Rhodospirillales bacterium]|nr:hypothetical protein [Rhodospirillales bacterium]
MKLAGGLVPWVMDAALGLNGNSERAASRRLGAVLGACRVETRRADARKLNLSTGAHSGIE